MAAFLKNIFKGSGSILMDEVESEVPLEKSAVSPLQVPHNKNEALSSQRSTQRLDIAVPTARLEKSMDEARSPNFLFAKSRTKDEQHIQRLGIIDVIKRSTDRPHLDDKDREKLHEPIFLEEAVRDHEYDTRLQLRRKLNTMTADDLSSILGDSQVFNSFKSITSNNTSDSESENEDLHESTENIANTNFEFEVEDPVKLKRQVYSYTDSKFQNKTVYKEPEKSVTKGVVSWSKATAPLRQANPNKSSTTTPMLRGAFISTDNPSLRGYTSQLNRRATPYSENTSPHSSEVSDSSQDTAEGKPLATSTEFSTAPASGLNLGNSRSQPAPFCPINLAAPHENNLAAPHENNFAAPHETAPLGSSAEHSATPLSTHTSDTPEDVVLQQEEPTSDTSLSLVERPIITTQNISSSAPSSFTSSLVATPDLSGYASSTSDLGLGLQIGLQGGGMREFSTLGAAATYAQSTDPTASNNNSSGKEEQLGYAQAVGHSGNAVQIGLREVPSPEDKDLHEVLHGLANLGFTEKLAIAKQLNGKYPTLAQELSQVVRDFQDEQMKSNLKISRITPNWNHRFQTFLEELKRCEDEDEGSERKRFIYSEIASLAQDFIDTAKTYGKIIISEVYTPPNEKTIRPQEWVGGVAGGEKYIVKNILFKFSIDQYGLYGSDEIAAKVASRDLLGLIQYFNLGLKGLCFPLMTLVDYLGFRVQALSLLPISKDTIVYGTSDGGRYVHGSDKPFNHIMKKTAKALNLKPHKAGVRIGSSKTLYSCADLEGHRGLDGRFYCLDFARTFPPLACDRTSKNEHLYRLFRPEFVKKYSQALCSDTYSGFVANHNPEEHIEEVKVATKFLFQKIIPQYAKELSTSSSSSIDELLTLWPIKENLHKRGINLCQMGILRRYVTGKPDSPIKVLLLTEMIARTAKHEIHELLRKKLKDTKLALQEPYKGVAVDYLNILFGKSRESSEYWKNTLKVKMNTFFPHALEAEELDVSCNLQSYYRGKKLICVLFDKVRRYANLKFEQYQVNEFATHPSSFDYILPVDESDLERFQVGVKHMNVVASSMGYYLKGKADAREKGHRKISDRLYQLAIEKFKEALDSNPDDKSVLRELAQVYAKVGEKVSAERTFLEAIEADPTDHRTWLKMGVFFSVYQKDSERAEHCFIKSLQCNATPSNAECMRRYAVLLEQIGQKEQARQLLSAARLHNKVASSKRITIYENERKGTNNTYGKEFLVKALDFRGAWSTKEGVPKLPKDKIEPGHGWEWVEPQWLLDPNDNDSDTEGWEYAPSWNSSAWRPQDDSKCQVRRRAWERTERKKRSPAGEKEKLIFEKMVDPVHGIQLKDQKFQFKSYSQCFTGREAVEYLTKTFNFSREEAVKFGKSLMHRNLIYHVTYEHEFQDAFLFYKFRETKFPTEKHDQEPPSEVDAPIQAGFLEKQGDWIKSWKTRYFVLRSGGIQYFKKKPDEPTEFPKGIISLVGATAQAAKVSSYYWIEKEKDTDCFFSIKTPNREWIMKAKNAIERENWVNSINSMCIQVNRK